MKRPRGQILRRFRTPLLLAALLLAPASFAQAQLGGYGGGFGYPVYGYGGYGGPMGMGYGYPGMGYGYGYGYGYPGMGYGFGGPGLGYGYGLGYNGVQQYFYPSMGYANPLFGLGLSPLGVQSNLAETALIRGAGSVGRTTIRVYPSYPAPGKTVTPRPQQ